MALVRATYMCWLLLLLQVFRRPELASVLRRLGAQGRAAFYEGAVAESIAAEVCVVSTRPSRHSVLVADLSPPPT